MKIFQLYCVSLLVEDNRYNHRPSISHWQTVIFYILYNQNSNFSNLFWNYQTDFNQHLISITGSIYMKTVVWGLFCNWSVFISFHSNITTLKFSYWSDLTDFERYNLICCRISWGSHWNILLGYSWVGSFSNDLIHRCLNIYCRIKLTLNTRRYCKT